MQSRDAKLLGEATGEILRIVEAYTVGYLRNISVGSFISHHLARDVETVVTDKLGCWQACLLGEILAQYTAGYTSTCQFLYTKLRIIVILLYHIHHFFHE